MNGIICLKLISGEEVIGKTVHDDERGTMLEDVASVMMMPGKSDPNTVSLGLMPFLPYAETHQFTFAKSSIVTSFSPNIDMINNYSRIYGSGIQIARSI